MKPSWLPFGAPRARNVEGPQYADILERAVAASLDLWVLYLIFFRLFQWLGAKVFEHVDVPLYHQALQAEDGAAAVALLWQSGAPQLWALNCSLQLLIIGLFLVSLQCLWHTTPGKWALGLKIVRRGDLQPPSHWQYVIRFLGYIVAALPLMIGIIWATFNKERRGWHDMIAGTVVIHTRPHGWYWAQVKKLYRRLRGADTPAS